MSKMTHSTHVHISKYLTFQHPARYIDIDEFTKSFFPLHVSLLFGNRRKISVLFRLDKMA